VRDDALDRAAAAVAEIREHSRALYGWSHVEVELVREHGVVFARGRVVASRQIRAIADALAGAMPGTPIDVRGISMLATGRWHALARSPIPLMRGVPTSRFGTTLATELVFGDGPVERLANDGAATLVRAIDGTVGWIDGALGPAVPAPVLGARRFDPDAFASAARRWVGTRYRLGGTTAAGIDCSALAQRCLRAAGAFVPRHSSDQLSIGDAGGEGSGDTGDLLFVWAADEAPCHVALGVSPDTLVHASRSRGCVLEEPRVQLLTRAGRVRHVPCTAVERLQRTLVGFARLCDVLTLGRTRS
jgi:cell wall-associated NlpC family hydrolase